MNKVNMGILVTVVIAIIAGAVFIGQLEGRIRNIEKLDLNKEHNELSQKLEEKAEEKIKKIKNLSESLTLNVETQRFSFDFARTGTPQRHTLWPQADACFLTKISGKFEGGGELVEIVRENDIWYLQGHSQQPDVKAGALCIKYSLKQKQAS